MATSQFITVREAALLEVESRLLVLRESGSSEIQELAEALLILWSVISKLNDRITSPLEHSEARALRPAPLPESRDMTGALRGQGNRW